MDIKIKILTTLKRKRKKPSKTTKIKSSLT